MGELSLWELVVGDDCPGNSSELAWGWVVYPFIMLYCFYLMARICDGHLTTALDYIVERLQLSEDVAGATFLAGASSAPELFTSIISTFIMRNASGVGNIVGSAVFNLLVIIGVTPLCSGKRSLDIWWYPTVRDAVWYAISILEIFLVMLDGLVYWWEGFIMTMSYVLYVLYFTQNERIIRKFGLAPPGGKVVGGGDAVDACAKKGSSCVANLDEIEVAMAFAIVLEDEFKKPLSPSAGSEESGLQPVAWLETSPAPARDEEREHSNPSPTLLSGRMEGTSTREPKLSKNPARARPKKKTKKKSTPSNDGRRVSRSSPETIRPEATDTAPPTNLAHSKPSESLASNRSQQQPSEKCEGHTAEQPERSQVEQPERQPDEQPERPPVEQPEGQPDEQPEMPSVEQPERPPNEQSEGQPYEQPERLPAEQPERQAVEQSARQPSDESEEKLPGVDVEDCVKPTVPEEEKAAGWCRYEPIMMFVNLVTPTRPERLVTLFVLCCVWISVFTYFAVDASTRLGCIMSLDDEVMGLVILAAGTSVPDAICSIVVAREGKGDMAVANAVGSNIFDILLCLGFPWFVWAAIQGEPIELPRNNIFFTMIVLVVCLFGYLAILVGNKWKLTKRMGLSLLALYVIVIVLILLQSYGCIPNVTEDH